MDRKPDYCLVKTGAKSGMSDVAPAAFDFAILDDLAFAAERGRLLDDSEIATCISQEIGPVVELASISQSYLLPTPQAAPWLMLDGLAPMVQALDNGIASWICPESRLMGFLRTSTSFPQDEKLWTSFGISAQSAATSAGFPRSIARQLVAAMGELHSNIYEHSQASNTGVVAYRANSGSFEIVVSDNGIGVLESLRSGSDHRSLRDHGEALRLTLTNGISRYGSNSNRGFGFRPLFIGLANLNGTLRFRSGDHALLIDGQNPTLSTARPAQKSALKGFFASISCKTA